MNEPNRPPKLVGYGQFCPVAKAAEVLATRWTPLILRELISGSSGFNEIRRGVPLMSRPLLSRRLKELQAADIVEHSRAHDSATAAYRLTAAGEELRPIIVAMGLWGQRWVESHPDGPDWDAGVLMWDMQRRIDTRELPTRRVVLQLEFTDAPIEMRRWWLLIEDHAVDLCQADPGFAVDLYITSKVREMGRVWIGKRSLRGALADDSIVLHGDVQLARTIYRWLALSAIAEAAAEAPR